MDNLMKNTVGYLVIRISCCDDKSVELIKPFFSGFSFRPVSLGAVIVNPQIFHPFALMSGCAVESIFDIDSEFREVGAHIPSDHPLEQAYTPNWDDDRGIALSPYELVSSKINVTFIDDRYSLPWSILEEISRFIGQSGYGFLKILGSTQLNISFPYQDLPWQNTFRYSQAFTLNTITHFVYHPIFFILFHLGGSETKLEFFSHSSIYQTSDTRANTVNFEDYILKKDARKNLVNLTRHIQYVCESLSNHLRFVEVLIPRSLSESTKDSLSQAFSGIANSCSLY